MEGRIGDSTDPDAAPQTGCGRLRTSSSRQTSQAREPSWQGVDSAPNLSPSDLECDRIRWHDLARITALGDRRFLNLPRRPSSSLLPLEAALRQLVPLVPGSGRVVVARLQHQAVAFAMYSISNPDRRWLLEILGARAGDANAYVAWEAVVAQGIVQAGMEGTKRLYARAARDSDMSPVVRRNGFVPFMGESVLGMLPTSIPAGGQEPGVRRQHRTDVWAIHQLYLATTPAPVQYAEAITSHQWDINQRFSASSVEAGWLVEDGHRVSGYLRAVSRPDGHVLEGMIAPESRGELDRLLMAAFSELHTMSPRPVSFIVREYQQEWIDKLINWGFAPQYSHDVLVKYTTVLARSGTSTVLSFPARDLAEPAVKRVPTFLNGTPRDPASEHPGSAG